MSLVRADTIPADVVTAPAPVSPHRALAVSYRRLDYWARCGYLRPRGEGRGSGNRRRWPAIEKRIAAVMIRLVDAGLTVPTAAVVARRVIVDGSPTGYARLGDGVYLSLVLDLDA